MNVRKYIAISIKHTIYGWKFGKPFVLWGFKHTKDNEERCFSGYTEYFNKAERYALGEFEKRGYGIETVKPEPVHMCVDLCEKYRRYDTVLVDEEEYLGYCKMCRFELSPKD